MGKHHHKVSPEPQPETDEAEPSKVPSYTVGLNWAEIPVAAKPKIKAAKSVVTVDIASLKMAAYVKKRQDMKERVVREVFEAAMPDVSTLVRLYACVQSLICTILTFRAL
jgi:hypothetical protein